VILILIVFIDRQKRAETNACYPEVGCFDTSGPYGYIGMVPNRPDEVISCSYIIEILLHFLEIYK